MSRIDEIRNYRYERTPEELKDDIKTLLDMLGTLEIKSNSLEFATGKLSARCQYLEQKLAKAKEGLVKISNHKKPPMPHAIYEGIARTTLAEIGGNDE